MGDGGGRVTDFRVVAAAPAALLDGWYRRGADYRSRPATRPIRLAARRYRGAMKLTIGSVERGSSCATATCPTTTLPSDLVITSPAFRNTSRAAGEAPFSVIRTYARSPKTNRASSTDGRPPLFTRWMRAWMIGSSLAARLALSSSFMGRGRGGATC